MRFLLLSFSCAFLSKTLVRRVGASCYYPDGTFPTDYVYTACSGSEFTSCCILDEADQCLANGLCYYPKGKYMFRGACSDKTWKSESCFQHCTGGDVKGTYDRLVSCGNNRYCCYSDGSTCCNDDSKVFNIGNTTIIKDLALTASFTLPVQTPTGLPKSGTSSTTLSRKTSSTESELATNTASLGTESNTAVAATSTPTSSTSKSSTGSHGVSKTIVIAGAIGGVVILIIAITLVWFCVRRRYNKKLAAGTNPQSFPMSGDGFQKLPDKTPRPVENPTPLHSPAPPYQPYQPPAYQSPVQYPSNGAVEIDNSYLAPSKNQWGQPIYEAPDQTYRRI
ncbi:hypothetical protein B0J11DRAFT_576962 [Dendryphion nanum]|uniref:Mid2 domain-containing protein n=1 Tax=Dendryphion nanum TaxID=256645 RepID=A0A9P9E5Z4_9PLEO|nr:hypothetical protein B0J11DRAFT_576962 [Dendryphion nanum]